MYSQGKEEETAHLTSSLGVQEAPLVGTWQVIQLLP